MHWWSIISFGFALCFPIIDISDHMLIICKVIQLTLVTSPLFYTVHQKKYDHSLRMVVLCCVLGLVDSIHILQNYFPDTKTIVEPATQTWRTRIDKSQKSFLMYIKQKKTRVYISYQEICTVYLDVYCWKDYTMLHSPIFPIQSKFPFQVRSMIYHIK